MERLEAQTLDSSASNRSFETQSARGRSGNSFAPESTRAAEIEAIVEFFRGVLQPHSAVYVSAPITSGRRFIDWLASFRTLHVAATPEEYQREHAEHVIGANRESIRALMAEVKSQYRVPVIDPTSVGDLPSWTQNDYRAAWASIIEAFAKTVIFDDGW
jgi:hypothetical protein